MRGRRDAVLVEKLIDIGSAPVAPLLEYEYQGDNLLIARVNLLMSFFDMIPELSDTQADEPEAVLCKIYNWRRDNSVCFKKLKEN